MANRVEIEILARDKTSGAIISVGQKLQRLGGSLTNMFTQPLTDLGRMLLQNEEIEKSIEPIQKAWGGVFDKLATSLVPVIERLTPSIIKLADFFSGLIDKFNQLDPKVQDGIVAFVGILGVIGPVITIIGGLVIAIGTIGVPIAALIGAIGLLVATIIGFGQQAWGTITMIGQIIAVLYEKGKENIENLFKTFRDAPWGDIGKAILERIGEAITKGVSTIISAAKKAAQSALDAALSLLGGGAGTQYAGGAYPGINHHAIGGLVTAGIPSIVGELGPEVFIPSTNGTIIPNNKIGAQNSKTGGGNITIVYSPQASFATQEEVRRNLVPLVRQAMRSA